MIFYSTKDKRFTDEFISSVIDGQNGIKVKFIILEGR